MLGAAPATPTCPASQLRAVEGLRLWRACAAHGVPAFAFDALYPQLAGCMVPPPPQDPAPEAPAAGGGAGAGGEGAAAAGLAVGGAVHASRQQRDRAVGHALRWHLARETHALLDALVGGAAWRG